MHNIKVCLSSPSNWWYFLFLS